MQFGAHRHPIRFQFVFSFNRHTSGANDAILRCYWRAPCLLARDAAHMNADIYRNLIRSDLTRNPIVFSFTSS